MLPEQHPPGVAVVGTGFIAPAHIEALRRLGRSVHAVVATSLEKAQAAASAWNIPCAYGSMTEMLADPHVQVVHLTSPNRYHFEQCKQALAAGKHVICEKPLALDTRETGELVRLAQAVNRVTAVCYNVRYYPLCWETRARVQAGDLGRVHQVTGSYFQDWLLYDTDFNWRVLAGEGGGLRALGDIGTHWLDLVQWLLQQDVVRVCADLHTFHPVRQRPRGPVQTFSDGVPTTETTLPVTIATEDYGSILLHFASGTVGVMSVSQMVPGRKNCLRWEIAAAQGSLAWDSERPNELWLGHRDRANELLLRDPALLHGDARRIAGYPGGHNEGFPDTFKQLFRAIYDYIETGDYQAPRSFPTFADGHKEVALCEAILHSHQERRWVDVRL